MHVCFLYSPSLNDCSALFVVGALQTYSLLFLFCHHVETSNVDEEQLHV